MNESAETALDSKDQMGQRDGIAGADPDHLEDHYEQLTDNEKWQKLLKSVDKNGDGLISVSEFIAVFDDFITIIHTNDQGAGNTPGEKEDEEE